MDKTTVIHVKNNRYTVHRAATKMPAFSAAYGLWIISFQRGSVARERHKIAPRYFEFYGLSHMLEGKGWYWTPARRRETFSKGCGVLSCPGTVQDYSSSEGDFVEDSICFAGPVADQLHGSGIISDGIMRIGAERRLLPIFDMAADPSRDSQIKANFALQTLLVDCYFAGKSAADDDDYPQLTALLEKIRRTPEKWWTTDRMKELCSLSENQFRVVFKRRTGISPKKYIMQVKMKRAAELLCNSTYSISRIGAMLGYRDPYHFSRCFKSFTGMSPEHYRQHYTIS